MKTTIAFDYYYRMFNLGIETWVTHPGSWKVFQVNLLLGPYTVTISLGSKKRFDEITMLFERTQA